MIDLRDEPIDALYRWFLSRKNRYYKCMLSRKIYNLPEFVEYIFLYRQDQFDYLIQRTVWKEDYEKSTRHF